MTAQPIPDAPGYLIDRSGAVYSAEQNWRGYGKRVLTQDLNSDGYPSVRIIVNGQRTRKTVHSLLAEVFLPLRPTSSHEIRHLDGVRTNNDLDNLTWGTSKDNADDRERHGHTSRGTKHSEAIKDGLRRAEQPDEPAHAGDEPESGGPGGTGLEGTAYYQPDEPDEPEPDLMAPDYREGLELGHPEAGR